MGMVISVESLISTALLQPLSEYHGPKDERVQRENGGAIAGYVFVCRVHLLIKSAEPLMAELLMMR